MTRTKGADWIINLHHSDQIDAEADGATECDVGQSTVDSNRTRMRTMQSLIFFFVCLLAEQSE
jgi:hypothetical protein